MSAANLRHAAWLVFTCVAVSAALVWGLAAGHFEIFPFGPAQRILHLFRRPLPVSTFQEQRALLFQMSRGHADVVMLGDSITQFPEWRELFPDTNVVNRGINSDTTADAVKRLDSVISLQPRKVFVMLGVNDLGYGESPEAILSRYAEIVRRLSQAGTVVIAQSVLFTADREKNKKIATLNQMLSLHCQQTNQCRYIDLTTQISPSDTYDGLHLTAQGYELWRQAIDPEISAPH